ncbi:MAG: ABC transporter permease [Clostridium sp.]|nr:ABC transporter permease [Clostridium sp.]MCM1398512.1 ABC transporter permease [Clostridium sp.]MCM1460234.1 ABC transporter permease [Bacteroides sp.]
MLTQIMQKIKNKMWLTTCLTLGMALLVAVFACQPMFKKGALNMMLRSNFDKYASGENVYPAVIGRVADSPAGPSGLADILAEIDGYEKTWSKYLGDIGKENIQTRVKLSRNSASGMYGSKGNYISLSYMPDLGSHVTLLDGKFYDSEYDSAKEAEGNYEPAMELVDQAVADGCYPCVMSQRAVDECGFVVGETVSFNLWENSKGEPLRLIVTGIFKESDANDTYWYIQPSELEAEVMISRESMEKILAEYQCDGMLYNHYVMLDYEDINSGNIEDIKYYVEQFSELDANFVVTFLPLLDDYMGDKKTIDVLLWVLQLPILGMVLAFIYMVSSQIAESEKNEIAMQRSRGLSRLQIISTYGAECGILAIYGLVFGLPLGYALCKLCAMTTDFLTFDGTTMYLYHITPAMLAYGAVATIIGTIFIIIPVISYSKVTIVQHKNMNIMRRKPAWERFFLDIILLGVALYLLRNFNQQKENIRLNVIVGNKMDPVIFLDSTLFIIGFGLLALRLSHYLVQLVYRIGKNKWRPAMYASFLQITRNYGKQGFISVFMILTVAMGLFNANTARTINQNHEERLMYERGADAVVTEQWIMNTFKRADNQMDYKYEEPDYVRFEKLKADPRVESLTKVLIMEDTNIAKGSKSGTLTLMGISSKEFGETAYFKEELNKDVHWFTYLNELAKNPNGVIISSNLAEEYELAVGDSITITRMGDTVKFKDLQRGVMTGTVCGIVDDWPGYDRYYYEDGEEKENHLMVANYSRVVNAFQVAPYEVWVKLADGVDSETFSGLIDEYEIIPKELYFLDDEITDMKQQPLIQITNGMFTLSFIIALVLCALGFLIYWISSIRQRELLFGVYRAMGLPVKELNAMLTNEHIFSTFLSVIAGGVVGMVSTLLFVKLFGIVYLPEKHNLDIYIYFNMGDIVKLAVVIVVMIVVCMLVLRRLIKSMNITQALKLGEE